MAFNPDILKKFTAQKKNEKQIPYTVKEAGLKGDITEVEGAKLLTYSENFAISPSLPPAELFNNECECCLELLPGVRAKKAEKLKNVGIRRIKDALSHEKHKKHAQDLSEILSYTPEELSIRLRERLSGSNRLFYLMSGLYAPKDLLFLDLETRSLFSETQIITIGTGYYADDKTFTVSQFTALNPDAEYEALMYLDALSLKFKALVTYNGRSFDVPFTNSRFSYYGLRNAAKRFSGFINFDLLHYCRAAFSKAPAHSLKEMEMYLLKEFRDNDIDGSEVDYHYSRWLKLNKPEDINLITSHNVTDVRSMALVLNKLGEKWAK